jgi:hypothetical protein
MIGDTPEHLVNGFDGFAILAVAEVAPAKDLLGVFG